MMEPVSVLALRNVPIKWSMKKVIATLTPIIKAQFTVASFDNDRSNNQAKIAYIRLPAHLDLNVVLQKIERVKTNAKGDWYMFGYVPEFIPKSVLETKGKTIGKKLANKHKIDVVTKPEIHLRRTLTELVREMQTKYLGLFKLSLSLNHELLDAISETIVERLTMVVKSFIEPQTGYNLGKAYRGAHPHSTDFNLIMTTLHRIEEAMGRPKSNITQTELLDVASVPIVTETLPSGTLEVAILNSAALRYLHPISEKVIEHIENLDTDLPQDNEDHLATIRVREELKKLSPYVSEVIREAVVKHLGSGSAYRKKDCHMRIYGEPYVPTRDACAGLIKRLNARAVVRSKYLYNLLMLSVYPGSYDAFMKTDGIMLGGAKLICRPSDVPLYKVRPTVLEKINQFYGIPGQMDAGSGDEDYEVMDCDDDGDDTGEEQ